MPYNVAFKLVTVSGPLMLPAAAYSFAKGMKAPWPAPPAFAIAAFGTLVQTRNDWQIYGGNIASTLAGEFSFCIASRVRAVRARRARVHARHRQAALAPGGAHRAGDHVAHRRRDLHQHRRVPAVAHAPAAAHVGDRDPGRRGRRRAERGVAAAAAVAAGVHAEHAVHEAAAAGELQAAVVDPASRSGPAHARRVCGTRCCARRSTRTRTRSSTSRRRCGCRGGSGCSPASRSSPRVGTGGARRWCSLVLALVIGVMFIEWPEHAIWNTRFLPFWMLSWAFARGDGRDRDRAPRRAVGVSSAYTWIRDGDLQDARARAWAEIATADDDDDRSTPDARKDAAWALADRQVRSRTRRVGSRPTELSSPRSSARPARRIGAIAIAVVVVLRRRSFALDRGFDAAGNNSAIAIRGWAAWNYSGYEQQGRLPAVQRDHDRHGAGRRHARQRPRAVGTVVGRPRRDQQLRHEPGAGAAPVLHAREDRLDGGHLLRVVGDDRLPLPHRQRMRAAPVESGARSRVRIARLRLRPVRAPPADARRPLLHGVDAGDAEAGGRRTRNSRW